MRKVVTSPSPFSDRIVNQLVSNKTLKYFLLWNNIKWYCKTEKTGYSPYWTFNFVTNLVTMFYASAILLAILYSKSSSHSRKHARFCSVRRCAFNRVFNDITNTYISVTALTNVFCENPFEGSSDSMASTLFYLNVLNLEVLKHLFGK